METYVKLLCYHGMKRNRGEATPNSSVDAEFSNYVKCKMLSKQLEALSKCLEGKPSDVQKIENRGEKKGTI